MRFLAGLAILAACWAGPALAQGPGPITTPIFDTPPHPVDLSGYSGGIPLNGVELRCRVLNLTPTACAATGTGMSADLVARAITAAASARLASTDAAGQPTEGRDVLFRVGVPIPVAVDPPPAPPDQQVMTGVIWVERPSGRDFAAYYPPQAITDHVQARVTLECIVGADGRLACTVMFDDHPEYGFDEATLRLARSFRMAPETRDGQPTAGGRIRTTIRWTLPD